MREIGAGLGSALVGQEVFPGANFTSDAGILKCIEQSVLKPIHHGSSSYAMAKPGANTTAVDSKVRVQVVLNLSVIDSSSFAFTLPGHTHRTCYAHAEKLLQDLINDYS